MKKTMMVTKKNSMIGTAVREAGFTLLELLLAVTVSSALLIAFTGLLQNVARDELANSTADYMSQLGEAVEDALSDPQIFDALHDLAVAPGSTAVDLYEMPLTHLTDGFDYGGGAVLEPSSILGQNFSATLPLKSDVTIILKVADTAPSARALDILIVADDPAPQDKVLPSALNLGSKGGVYRDNPLIAANDPIQGVYGVWELPFADFAGAPWHTSATATGIPAGEAYLAYYSYVNEEDIIGDYLYRTPQLARPDLHIMNNNLDLSNYNMLGVDNLTLSGDANINQDLIVQGALYVGGTSTFDGNVQVDGTAQAGTASLGNTSLNLGARTAYNVNPSEFYVQNGLTVSNNVDVDEVQATDVQTGQLNAENIEVTLVALNGGDLNVDSVAGVAVSRVENTDAAMTLTNELRTNQLTIDGGGAGLTANIGTVGLIAFTNQNNLNVTNNLNAVQIDNQTVDFDNFNNCDQGCVETF